MPTGDAAVPDPDLTDFDAEAGLLGPLGLALAAVGLAVAPLRLLAEHSEVRPVAAAAGEVIHSIHGLSDAMAGFVRAIDAERQRREHEPCPSPPAN
jgi:hypothetical protein